MASTILQVGTAKARRGQKSWGQIKIREGRKSVSLPVCIINGAREGEHAIITANQHGRELPGLTATSRFCTEIDPRKIKGSIVVIPSMNPTAAIHALQAWTEDEAPESAAMSYGSYSKDTASVMSDFCYRTKYNMNWNWPGKKGGTLIQRMIYEIWRQVVLNAPRKPLLLMDMHCHVFPSAVYASGEKERGLAILSGLRHVYVTGGVGESSLEGNALKHGIPHVLTAELSSNGTAPLESTADGVRMIHNLLKYFKMLPGKLELPEKVLVLKPWGVTAKNVRGAGSIVVNAKQKGIMALRKRTIEHVKKGELIGEVIDPYTGRTVQVVRASTAGWLGYLHEMAGVIEKGQRICRIDPYAEVVNPAKKTSLPSVLIKD